MKSVLNYKKPAFWLLIAVGVACIAAALCLFTTSLSEPQATDMIANLDNTQYKVTEVLYCDGRFSFIEDESNAPQYYIAAGKLLWQPVVQEGKGKNSWTEIGSLEQCDLNRTNFEGLFMDKQSQNVSPSAICSKIVTAQRAEQEFNGLQQFFYLLQLEDAEVLLGRGYYHDDGTPFIRWLQKLEQVSAGSAGGGDNLPAVSGQEGVNLNSDAAVPEVNGNAALADEPAFERYCFENSVDLMKPTIILAKDDQRFQFTYSALSSYFAVGQYELTADKLVLNTDDGVNTYVFKVVGSTFVFDAGESAAIPEYKYAADSLAQSPVPDGAIFVLSK